MIKRKSPLYPPSRKGGNNPDYFLVGIILVLLAAGLAFLSSASVILATQQFKNPYFYFKKQLFFGALNGLASCYIISKISYKKWKPFAFFGLILSLILLALVFVPGVGWSSGGAARWFKLGPVNFQPAEYAKLALIFYLAAWLSNKGEKVKDFHESFLPFIFIVVILAGLLIKQPDIGTLGILMVIALSIFFTAGAKLRHIWIFILFGAASLWVMIKAAPYRMQRFLVFLNPKIDPQGIGYQINQALIAIGSGGILGLGLGFSRQKFNYLPEPMGDSIFAIICEETGLAGASIVLILFGLFAWRGYRIAKNAPDKFGRLLAVGITSWIVFQALVNIAAITSLIPLTGVTLPFISYGSSSLFMALAGAGVLINISKR